MTWTAIRVRPSSPAASELVSAALFAAGSQGIQEDGELLVTQFESDGEVERARGMVLDADAAATVDVQPVPDVDWTREWKHGVRAHTLGTLVVTPPWLADDYPADVRVVIEPGMAFGTGEHATTRGVVRLMQKALRPGDRVADLGAGSAVLAIAAAKLGSGPVAAIEMDPDAIENAEDNVRANGVEDRVQVILGDAGVLLPLVAPVRLVLANIISSVLTELLPTIAASLAPGGQSILSGILQEERPQMLEVLESGGWRVTDEDREDVWWSALIERR